MIGAFFFIAWRSFFNRILFRIRKLRQPRYLISAVAGAAYFYFLVFRRGGKGRGIPQSFEELGLDVIACAIGALLIVAWTLPNHAAVEFSEAEIHFLFSGPVSRRQALLYKVFRAQPTVIASVLVMSILHVPNGYGIGMWAVITTIAVYLTFIALVRTRLELLGVPGWAITIGAFGLLGGFGWLLYENATDFEARGASPFNTPIARALLFVPRAIPELLITKDPAMLALYVASILAVATGLFFAASTLRVPLEELAMNASEHMTKRRLRVRARRSGHMLTIRRIRPLFALPADASPELAIAWKHLTAAIRMAAVWIGIIVGLYAAIFSAGILLPGFANPAFVMSIFLVMWFPLAGSGLFGQDLRLDYRNFDILRTFPIAGDRLIGAAMLAPLALISAIELMFIVGGAILANRASERSAGFFGSPEFVVLALLFAIPVCASQLAVRNAIPIMLPAWGGQSKEDMRGFVAIGQKIVATILKLLVLAAMLIPAAAAAAGGFWIATRIFNGGPAVLAITAVPAVALLVGEVWIAISLLGSQFDQLDATSDVDPAAA